MSAALCTLLAACSAGLAVLMWLPAPHRLRAEAVGQPVRRPGVGAPLAAAMAGLAVILLVGGWVGWFVGAVVVIVGPILLRRFESRSQRERRRMLQRQVPAFLDLLSAVLASGAALQPSLRVVSQAIGDPLQATLRQVTLAMELGAEPKAAWSSVGTEPDLEALADAVIRSASSGAPLAEVLKGAAVDVRRRHRAQLQVAARTAGVRAVAPLGACFLPAFLVLGVVPVVASLAEPLLAIR